MRNFFLFICIVSALTFTATRGFAQSQPFGFSLYFEKGEGVISNSNRLRLDELRMLLKDSTYNSIFIKGYADNDGSDEFNQSLSEQRVASVQAFLYNQRYKLETRCYGEKEALNKNRNEDEKSLNRRVDIIFWTNYTWTADKKPQIFKGMPNRVIAFTAAEGTQIKIPANALVNAAGNVPYGEVEIAITEFYSLADIVRNKLTTSSGAAILISDGMINIEALRNGQQLKLKEGATMEVGFAEREQNDGFGIFYGNTDQYNQVVNWVPAVDTKTIQEDWYYSGVKLFESDTIERWRCKLEFNNLGQRVRVTERWVEGKGLDYDTIMIDKTINKNNIILQSTRLGWINCDQFYEPSQPLRDVYVQIDDTIDPEIVMIFKDRKAMISATKSINGKYVFSGVPLGEKVIIAGIGSGEGKLYFTKQEVNCNGNEIVLSFEETGIDGINRGLSGFN